MISSTKTGSGRSTNARRMACKISVSRAARRVVRHQRTVCRKWPFAIWSGRAQQAGTEHVQPPGDEPSTRGV
jgi:hypothetical protein